MSHSSSHVHAHTSSHSHAEAATSCLPCCVQTCPTILTVMRATCQMALATQWVTPPVRLLKMVLSLRMRGTATASQWTWTPQASSHSQVMTLGHATAVCLLRARSGCRGREGGGLFGCLRDWDPGLCMLVLYNTKCMRVGAPHGKHLLSGCQDVDVGHRSDGCAVRDNTCSGDRSFHKLTQSWQ